MSYKNPFDDYNANVLAPEVIMQYWCTPFSTGALKEFDERNLNEYEQIDELQKDFNYYYDLRTYQNHWKKLKKKIYKILP